MVHKLLKDHQLVLASKSPRRQSLLKELGFEFEVRLTEEVDESFPNDIPLNDIAEYLAVKKAEPYLPSLKTNEILITADTTVVMKDEILNKPLDREDAYKMIRKLSNNEHLVITGVCISNQDNKRSFSAITKVFFKELTDEEIYHYIDEYKPFDKAGAYGIQEWIGYIGIKHIEGSYFNVMGLPVQKLYEEINEFVKEINQKA